MTTWQTHGHLCSHLLPLTAKLEKRFSKAQCIECLVNNRQSALYCTCMVITTIVEPISNVAICPFMRCSVDYYSPHILNLTPY